jgi:hypothetical protein
LLVALAAVMTALVVHCCGCVWPTRQLSRRRCDIMREGCRACCRTQLHLSLYQALLRSPAAAPTAAGGLVGVQPALRDPAAHAVTACRLALTHLWLAGRQQRRGRLTCRGTAGSCRAKLRAVCSWCQPRAGATKGATARRRRRRRSRLLHLPYFLSRKIQSAGFDQQAA